MIETEKVLAWLEENSWYLGPWETMLIKMAMNGQWDYKSKELRYGFVDAHIHLDRVMTFESRYFPAGMNLNEISDLPLEAKQDLVGFLHEGEAYSEESLQARMSQQIERAIRIGTRQMWAVVDTTPDIGLRAFNVARKLKKDYEQKIDLRVACYPLFGFKNLVDEIDRYRLLLEAAENADFIVGLPEKDDDVNKVGFKGHVNLLLEMAVKYKLPLHIHVDQKNSALQQDSFRVIECLEGLTPEKLSWFSKGRRPKLWLVHVISPSAYSGERFSYLLELLLKYNIGVIVCPSAGISMRNLRSENAPLHNSLARVIEMLKVGITVELGADNVNDYLVPSGNGLILREIAELSNIVRNYASHVLVKIGMGVGLNNGDRAILAKSLYESNKAYLKHYQQIEDKERRSSKPMFDY
jgi:cytosine/adenosine deaminase-related metal-dependent hydrolase